MINWCLTMWFLGKAEPGLANMWGFDDRTVRQQGGAWLRPGWKRRRSVLPARISSILHLWVIIVELGKFDPPLWHAPYGRIV